MKRLVDNVDPETWRRFTGLCKMRGIIVGRMLTKVLDSYLEDYINNKCR